MPLLNIMRKYSHLASNINLWAEIERPSAINRTSAYWESPTSVPKSRASVDGGSSILSPEFVEWMNFFKGVSNTSSWYSSPSIDCAIALCICTKRSHAAINRGKRSRLAARCKLCTMDKFFTHFGGRDPVYRNTCNARAVSFTRSGSSTCVGVKVLPAMPSSIGASSISFSRRTAHLLATIPLCANKIFPAAMSIQSALPLPTGGSD
mmetsp:Transcript_14255/g.21327  ORF Transcript_14255/g.21327 Transcript_14255/m.21327 type:complete len:207 (-) Transcript_14255:673-1293(-)